MLDFLLIVFMGWLTKFTYEKWSKQYLESISFFITSAFKSIFYNHLRYIKQTLKEAHNFIVVVANHPFYDKIGIFINALFLLVCCTYATLLFAQKLEEGHSVLVLLVCLIIFLGASINLFYQSVKLYK